MISRYELANERISCSFETLFHIFKETKYLFMFHLYLMKDVVGKTYVPGYGLVMGRPLSSIHPFICTHWGKIFISWLFYDHTDLHMHTQCVTRHWKTHICNLYISYLYLLHFFFNNNAFEDE